MKIEVREYDDGCARGIQILVNDENCSIGRYYKTR